MSTVQPTDGRRPRLITFARGIPYPTVDSLKVQLNIAADDTSKDEAIQSMLDYALAMIETFCGRMFMLDDYEEHFLPIDTRNPYLLLSAFPVEKVNSITRDLGFEDHAVYATLTGWKLYPQQGLLQQFSHGCCWCCCYDWNGDTIIDYRGGFPPDAWPPELVGVLTRLFFDLWNATGGTGNIAMSTGGGSGAIKSATVDGMRLDYDVGAGVSFKGAGDIPPELWPYAAVLSRWRKIDMWAI